MKKYKIFLLKEKIGEIMAMCKIAAVEKFRNKNQKFKYEVLKAEEVNQ